MTQPLPEVHLIGEILNGDGFSSANAFAKFTIESGEEWDCAGGDESGQTQVDYPGMVCCDAHLFHISSFMCFDVSSRENIFGIIQLICIILSRASRVGQRLCLKLAALTNMEVSRCLAMAFVTYRHHRECMRLSVQFGELLAAHCKRHTHFFWILSHN